MAFDIDDIRASFNTPIQTRFFSGALPPKPGNIKKVIEIEELVSFFRNQTLDSPKLTLLDKTLKAVRLAMADRVLVNYQYGAVGSQYTKETTSKAYQNSIRWPRCPCFEYERC